MEDFDFPAEGRFNVGTPRTYYKTKKEEGLNLVLWKNSKVSENHEHEKQTTTKNGEIRYNIPVQFIAGKLKDVRIKNNPNDGKPFDSYEFILRNVNADGEEIELVLSCSYGSKYANHIIAALPNCDLSKSIMIRPYSMPIEGTDKYNSGTTIYQGKGSDGKPLKIDKFYDMVRDADGNYVPDGNGSFKTINGFPAPIKRKKAGKDEWNFDAQNERLENYVMNVLRAKLLNLHTQNVSQFAPPPTDEFVPDDIDDLPF